MRIANKMDNANNVANYRLPVAVSVFKSTSYTLHKDKRINRQSFVGSIQYKADLTMRPGAYQVTDPDSFGGSPKETRFAFNKAARVTLFADLSKQSTKLPSPLTYSPDWKYKIGNTYRK